MRVKLSVNFEIKNPWRLIVLAQLAVKGIKLIRALHKARQLGKKIIKLDTVSQFNDL